MASAKGGARARLALFALFALLLASGCQFFDPDALERYYQPPQPDGGMDAGTLTDGAMPQEGGARDATLDANPRDARSDGDSGNNDASAECGSGRGEIDCCPDDDDKLDPGGCGCGVADVDGDGDEVLDCVDECPDDREKSTPGTCGCGSPDELADGGLTCSDLVDALEHRYRFEGNGVTITDSAGDRDGLLIGASLTGTGTCVLAGGTSEQYIDLPNGIISGLTNATIELWLDWDGQGVWPRIFDFGTTSSAAEGSQGVGSTFIYLTPNPDPATGVVMRLVYATMGTTGQTVAEATELFPSDGVHHVAAVFDDSNDQMRLYLDGELEGTAVFTGTLSSITDVNNWFGRSQFIADAELGGALHEARIYDAALTDEQVEFSFEQGSDPSFLP
jgi:hypothetical protein